MSKQEEKELEASPFIKLVRPVLMACTFFEYFDLMIFVHMSYVLNDLFFDKGNNFLQTYGSTIAFCSTFLIKPIGGLVLGWWGDKYGRKTILVICTIISTICCFGTVLLPTYVEIGVWASITITLFRLLQGLASSGECMSAEIYICENTKPPARYYNTALVSYAGVIGMFTAICITKITVMLGLNWKFIFIAGGVIVLIGYRIRLGVVESPEFYRTKQKFIKLLNINPENPISREQLITRYKLSPEIIGVKQSTFHTRFAFFCIFCGWPVCFYFSYIFCSDVLKHQFDFSKEMIINHNFKLALLNLIGLYFWVHLTKKHHPFKLLKGKLFFFIPFLFCLPYLLDNATSPNQILLIQTISIVMGNSIIPAKGALLMHFFTLERFKLTALLSGLSHCAVYILTAFGTTYFTSKFGNYGILITTGVATMFYSFGLFYFIKKESIKNPL